jgi:hypothetical protein
MMEALRAEAENAKQERLEKWRKQWGWVQSCGRFLTSLVFFALALAPAWVTGRLIHSHAVNTPFGDDWRLVDQLVNLHLDHLEWRELCEPIDGERSPLPQLLHLAALRLTGGDLRADAWMNFTWMSLTSIGFLLLLLRTAGGGFGSAVIFFLANLAIFSPAQNLFAMRQAGILLPVTCLVWTHLIASFHCSTVLKFATCALLTSIAAANGVYGLSLLLTVPVLACFTVGLPCRVRPWIFAGTWALFATLVLRTYFLEWSPSPPLTTTASLAPDAPPRLENGFVLASQILASPLTEDWWAPSSLRVALGIALAAMLLAIAAWTLVTTIGHQHKSLGASCAPWLLLGIGGLVGVGLITGSRLAAAQVPQNPSGSGLTLGHAALPVIMGAFVPFYLQVRDWSRRLPRSKIQVLPSSLLFALFAAAVASQLTAWLHGWETVHREHQDRLRSRVALHLSRVFPPHDPAAFGTQDAALMQERAQFLHNEGYLKPLLLHEPVWPDRRIAQHRLSLLEGRVTAASSAGGTPVFRIIARFPSRTPGRFDPAAGILLAYRDPFDPTQHRLLAAAKPDPADRTAWLVPIPLNLPSGANVEFWALDGHSLLAHPLAQVLSPEGELQRGDAPPNRPAADTPTS